MEKEIFVEEVWRVDKLGRFKEKIQGTDGMIIRYSDCERMEFFKVEE